MATIKFDQFKILKFDDNTNDILKLEWVERSSAQELRKLYDRGKFLHTILLHKQEIKKHWNEQKIWKRFSHS